jgi:hypothetical protein
MQHKIDLRDKLSKNIYSLSPLFAGISPSGETLGFTNYYMEINNTPFFGVSGEIHYSRLWEEYWEDELLKMKNGGINIISTYVFWIHHEEEEGVFDFSGRRNIRHFVKLCAKHGLYCIVRIGPFAHGEVRNGGIPDWLYGKPCEVRSLDKVFLLYTKRFYEKISAELKNLFYRDGGPIIAVQLDNEYGHSGAPWELTTGVSNEWLSSGSDGNEYMHALRDLAIQAGINAPIFSCTGWGGAATPDTMMTLWGGYAFRPWIFYSHKGVHPATEEYIYRDNHNNIVASTYNFEPRYKPETRPYLCCEMGGGMGCSYNYRFQLPFESVDAMANIKTASGCNMLGYYMFHGGTNPTGKHTPFLNESQVPKRSYDFQAPLGEYGQVRDSYRRLRCFHLLTKIFEKTLCAAKTILPDSSQDIEPEDVDFLRYAVRSSSTGAGFLFINNYQDHVQNKDKSGETVAIQLPKGDIVVENISLAIGENCVLPFNLEINGIPIRYALAQPLSSILEANGEAYAFFFAPEGMKPSYHFEKCPELKIEFGDVSIDENSVFCSPVEPTVFTACAGRKKVHFVTLTRKQSLDFQQIEWNGRSVAVLTDAALIASRETIKIEHVTNTVEYAVFPDGVLPAMKNAVSLGKSGIFNGYRLEKQPVEITPELKKIGPSRYIVKIPSWNTKTIKDVLLQVHYTGDIGHAFIDGDMIADNFWNGAVWEIGLREFAENLKHNPLTLYITPLKEQSTVNVESTMAGRREESTGITVGIESITATALYEWDFNSEER